MLFLITGGAGFIGSNLARCIIARGDSVRILDNLFSGYLENLNGLDIDFIEGDIRDRNIAVKATKGVDYVLHHAAISSVVLSVEKPRIIADVNIMGSINMLEAAAKQNVKGFYFASSAAIYGDAPELPKIETMLPKPLSPYAVSKLAIEHMCFHYNEFRGLNTKVLRYFNIFGPNQDPNSAYSAVIPGFISCILKDQKLAVYGDGLQTRDFLFVDNIADAIYSSLAKDFFVSNIASGKSITLLELIEFLKNISNKTSLSPEFFDERPADIKFSSASTEFAELEFAWNPQISIDDGLKRTYSFYHGLQ